MIYLKMTKIKYKVNNFLQIISLFSENKKEGTYSECEAYPLIFIYSSMISPENRPA